MGDAARLIVLGSSTIVPRPARDTSCYLVDDGQGGVILVDLGPGALHRAARAGYDLDRLTAVLVTHVHPDHCTDLVTLLFALKNPIPRRGLGPLEIWGHPQLSLLAARLRNAWPGWLAPGPRRVALREVAAPGPLDPPVPGATRVTAHPVTHIPSSWGYRLTLPNGCVVAFSGDCALSADGAGGAQLAALGRDADLFVLEAAAPDERPVRGHLTPREAGRVAAEAGVRHLVLTHFYPPVEQVPIEARVRESFEGRLTLAHDGEVLPLTR